MRQVVLDTETTGLEVSNGHRVIEIGCIEIIHRRVTDQSFHHYLNPNREIDEGALAVHGITQESLTNKPSFSEIVDDLIQFIDGAELIIHNADFDIGFINAELSLAKYKIQDIHECCTIYDSLKQARKLHPGQKNNLDALCKRYEIDNSHRELHGALLDAQILADVYLAMTGGQTTFSLNTGTGQFYRSSATFLLCGSQPTSTSLSCSQMSKRKRRMSRRLSLACCSRFCCSCRFSSCAALDALASGPRHTFR